METEENTFSNLATTSFPSPLSYPKCLSPHHTSLVVCGVPLTSPDDTPLCHCPLLTSHKYVTIRNASDIARLYVSLCAPSLHMSSCHCVYQLAEFTLSSRESHFFSADHSKDRDAWVEAFTRVAVSAPSSNCTMRIWLQFL